jgi:hypothetical protein
VDILRAGPILPDLKDGNPASQPGFPLDDHLVVIGRARDRLHILNPVARFIREASITGMQAGDIAQSLSDHYGIPHSEALRDVSAALNERRSTTSLVSEFNLSGSTVAQPHLADVNSSLVLPPDPYRQQYYRLADEVFIVRYGNAELYKRIHGLLEHLSDAVPGSASKAVDCWCAKDRYYVLNDGELRTQSDEQDHAILGVIREVAELAYRKRDWLTVCHAGAISDGNQCIVMPALSGSGKSTLTAALSYAGWIIMSDDVVPIDRHSHVAVSVPIPLNLKQASLSVLSHLDAQIDKTPGFSRGDESVHYLIPPQFAKQPPASSYPVKMFVYHRYLANVQTRLQPLSHVESLQRLIQSDCMLPQPLQDVLVEELVEWVATVPAYELVYSELDKACDVIAGLITS